MLLTKAPYICAHTSLLVYCIWLVFLPADPSILLTTYPVQGGWVHPGHIASL